MFKNNWNGKISESTYFSPHNIVIIAGPCMLESLELGLEIGTFLKEQCKKLGFPYVFKSSYDKANRLSKDSQRGPGIEQGLKWLAQIKENLNVPILTDVHSSEQALKASEFCNIIQIPAFLCQDKEILDACAEFKKTVIQIKKAQWLSAEELLQTADYLRKMGQNKVTLVERGVCFGYNNLSVDFRSLVTLQREKYATIFDTTHAVQLPGAGNGKTIGLRDMVLPLVKAAVATGVDGVFLEVHKNPKEALSDPETQLEPSLAIKVLESIARIRDGISKWV
jgi:2-dehydro-3-deoxyphosphooctonate aldolase (KDO 8-P synthase)